MKGVNLLVDPQVVLEVRELHGELLSNKEGKPPFFDDPNSFRVRIDQGEVAMTPESLSALLNGYVFNDASAPVKDVKIEIENGHVKQTATLKRKIPVEATIEGDLSVTPEGTSGCTPRRSKRKACRSRGCSISSTSSCPR